MKFRLVDYTAHPLASKHRQGGGVGSGDELHAEGAGNLERNTVRTGGPTDLHP